MAITLDELKTELSAIDITMTEILANAKEKNGGQLTEEQREEYDKLDASYDEKYKTFTGFAEDLKRQKKLDTRKTALNETVLTRTIEPNIIGSTSTVGNVQDGFLSDPKRGFENHRDLLIAVMETAKTGHLTDKRLRSLAIGSDEGSTVSDPYGGFLLPVGFSPTLLSVGVEGDPTVGRTTQIPMNTQTMEIPARVDKNHTSSVSGGLQVYRRNETDTSGATRQEFEQIKLTATMLFGIAYATEELLERSPISFIALLEAGFSDEFAAKILKEKLFGTGVGEYEGAVTAKCVVSQAKESSQTATTLVYENVINMRSRCWGYGNAIWIANHDTLPQLMVMNQTVGTGGMPVWQPSAREDHPDTLLGRPLFFSEFAETLGTLGDILLGNWSQYLEATLSGQQQAESIHVRFINHERTFKLWMENDGKCWWRSPLTPNKSSTTLSPFVTLAARA